uniref:Uncharacterized protein n=1 Tax=Nelumbo nucifera TaxID=4432 RepID=A0A822XQT6_NELNU|nr:TPA_asm: hypothetical protein HUJ06_022932 [Nelumbo nucifera]
MPRLLSDLRFRLPVKRKGGAHTKERKK